MNTPTTNAKQAQNNLDRPAGTDRAGRDRRAVVDCAYPGEMAALTDAVDELRGERDRRERASDRYSCPR